MTKEYISKGIRPCSADIPPPPVQLKRDNISSTAVFNTTLVWKPGDIGTISISFNPNSGAWSHLGKESNSNRPSMNLGWVDAPLESFSQDGYTFDISQYIDTGRNYCQTTSLCSTDGAELYDSNNVKYICKNGIACIQDFEPGSVILHEFGHALGMYHEHQNYLDNGNPIVYDIDGSTLFSLSQQYGPDDMCVQTYCSKMCYSDAVRPYFCNNNCDKNAIVSPSCESKWNYARDLATTNVLERYECTDSNCPYKGSTYDNNSVMLYQVDDYMIKPNNQGVRDNPTKPNFHYSDSDKEWLGIMYPIDNNNPPKITIEFLDGEDWQKYWVKKMVMEYLKPCVGIDFIFNLPIQNESIYNNKCTFNSGTLPINPDGSKPTSDNVNGGTTSSSSTESQGLTSGSIILIILAIIAVIGLLVILFI